MGVLWITVTLSTALLELSLWLRVHRLAAANVIEQTRAQAAAEAALADVIARAGQALRDSTQYSEVFVDPWFPARRFDVRGIQYGDVSVTTRVIDAGAFLNINSATAEELTLLLRAIGVESARAAAIASSIVDWRDTDDVTASGISESRLYEEAASPVLPANTRFATLRDLAFVAGLDSADHQRITPNLTAIGNGTINLNTAPAAVLRTLPGITEPAAQVIVAHQQPGRQLRSVFEPSIELSGAARDAFDNGSTQMASRATVRTQQLVVEIDAVQPGSHVRVALRALLERDGPRVQLRWRSYL